MEQRVLLVSQGAANAAGDIKGQRSGGILPLGWGAQTSGVLMLCYGSGLRISEAVSLKVSDIDSKRMLVAVRRGKGNKDRCTVLSGRLLMLPREYWKIQRPLDWLFPAIKADRHIQEGTIRQVCREACQLAGIVKRVTPAHAASWFRHPTAGKRHRSAHHPSHAGAQPH